MPPRKLSAWLFSTWPTSWEGKVAGLWMDRSQTLSSMRGFVNGASGLKMQFLDARFSHAQKNICKEQRIGSATHFPSDTTPVPVTTPDWGLGGPWLGSFGVNFLITNSCRIL